MKKATGGTLASAQKSAMFYLFSGLVTVVGISTIFAEAIFEFLGLNQPAHFQWTALVAYLGFCAATAFIFYRKTIPPPPELVKNQDDGNKPDGSKNITVNQTNIGGSGNTQTNTFN